MFSSPGGVQVVSAKGHKIRILPEQFLLQYIENFLQMQCVS